MKVQNVFIICLLVLPLTCGMHKTHLKPFLLHHKQCVHDVMTLLHYFWYCSMYYPGVWVKLAQDKLCFGRSITILTRHCDRSLFIHYFKHCHQCIFIYTNTEKIHHKFHNSLRRFTYIHALIKKLSTTLLNPLSQNG